MTSGESLTLFAPLSGPIVSLDAVPDRVFAERMVGDGISIDPVSQTLLAPCDATVAQIHASRHAVALTSEAGVELLIHIGLETVNLNGEGFKARVRVGDKVKAGQPLIDFDADHILKSAYNPLTQMVITGGSPSVIARRASGLARAGETALLTLRLGASPAKGALPTGGAASEERAETVTVPNANGLHARPAAVIAAAAKEFAGEVRLELGDKSANAKSVVSILSLGVGPRAELRVIASGEGAAEITARIVELIRGGLGEDLPGKDAPREPTRDAAPARDATPAPAARPADDARKLHGVTAAPGVAIGPVFKLDALAAPVERHGDEPDAELLRLREAVSLARLEIKQLISESGQNAQRSQIFTAHLAILDDPETSTRARDAIRGGASAAFAWREAVRWGYEALAALDNPLLAARAVDLRDVGQRVLLRLTSGHSALTAPPGSIVVAASITPSDVVRLAEQQAAGIVTVQGGTTSHVAILARSLGLPCLVGIAESVLARAVGTTVVLDADRATLHLDPDEGELSARRAEMETRAAARAALEAQAGERAVTRDGVHVGVLANIASAADARRAVRLGAEGVGLLRTEFMFLERATAPTEAEQAQDYAAIATALEGRPLVIRTLDVGGDKPLPYLPLPSEENPLLGIRGLRIGWLHPELLRTQICAIVAGARREGPRRRVMLPMVATIDELREAKATLEEERKRTGAPAIELGIMIEVPSAAIQAELFAPEVDFFSIGTNDLTQYTLAMDRTHPRLASRQDALHPAVLRLIDTTAKAGRAHGKSVSICGAVASDLDALPVLIGLGVTDLSVSIPSIPEVKARIRELDAGRCREIAKTALNLPGSLEVRALLAREAAPTATKDTPK